MTREFGFDHITWDDRSVLTTGTFDGVHLGHQAILRYLVERAHEIGGAPTLVTFDPHPREVLAGTPMALLTTLNERADVAEALGMERFVVIPFSRDLSLLEPEAYVEDILMERVGLREIVIGYDHRFGRERRGDRATLERLGREHGFSVDVIPEQVESGVTVSSTEVRRVLVEKGDARRAAELLGRPYHLAGTVVRGDQRGRTIGYPTANLHPTDSRKVIPAAGVYAVRATLPDGLSRGGMMNIGRRPTFEVDGPEAVEVHLFDFEGNLYGRTLAVDLIARLRDEKRFDGPKALISQLHEDQAEAKRILRPIS